MPDVFKILKDLELKSVGLDPQTNKMQEGYFVSFRSVGLPIHKEDFANKTHPIQKIRRKQVVDKWMRRVSLLPISRSRCKHT
jgi:hypothetical protein